MKTELLSLAGITLMLFSVAASAQTAGTLTFNFTPITQTVGAYSGTKNVLAVWIQSTGGGFIKSKLRYCSLGSTEDHLPTYGVNCGATASNCITNGNVTDATTGATLPSYTAKSITWDGKNVSGTLNGTVVPDGTYQVTIQETWGHGTATVLRSFSFTKGPIADHQTPAADTKFTGISLDWVPTGLGLSDNVSPNTKVVIYPNPTNGIFNIDFKNEINNIRVSNMLGQVLLDEKVTDSAVGTTKNLDLSRFGNGIYIINVSNNEGTSNYKVVLDK